MSLEHGDLHNMTRAHSALGEMEAAEEQEWILGKTTQVCQLHYFLKKV